MASIAQAWQGAPSLASRQAGSARRTVVHVTWSLVAGGSEMYALTIARHLDRRHFRSCMCAIDQGGALEGEIQRLGIPMQVMHRAHGIDLRLPWRLLRLFRRLNAQVIHTHHFNQLFYSILPARLLGARVIHTEHSIECYKKRRLRIAMRLLSLFCDKVTAIGVEGEAVLRDRVGIPARKLQVIRAGVDVGQFNEPAAEARSALGIAADAPVAAIVARLFPEKNHAQLLDAFARVVRELPGAVLLIVGDGVERSAIAAQIERCGLGASARMLGVRRDVGRILAACDAFVLASDREGLPIAVLEAMAAARPVVATAVGDLPQVVEDGVTGRLVPARDGAALAGALRQVLGDRALARRMGEAARAFVEPRFGLRSMVCRHERLYDGSTHNPHEAS